MKAIVLFLLFILTTTASADIDLLLFMSKSNVDATTVKADTITNESFIDGSIVSIDTIIKPVMVVERGTILSIRPTGHQWGLSESPPHYLIVQVTGVNYGDLAKSYIGYTLKPAVIDVLKEKYQNKTLNILVDTIPYNNSTVIVMRRIVVQKANILDKFMPVRYYPTGVTE